MPHSKFTMFNVGGVILSGLGIVSAAFFFGNLPWVKEHLEKIIWALILVPGLLAIYGGWKTGRKDQQIEIAER